MPVASAVLGFGQFPTAGAVIAFICPADKTALVKSVYASNYTSTDALLQCYVQDPITGIGASLFWEVVGANKTLQWQGWAVLEPGQKLVLSSPITTVHWWASGSILDGLAD
jgi:hypothetical protein